MNRRGFIRTASGLLVPSIMGLVKARALAQSFGSGTDLPFFSVNSTGSSLDPLVDTWQTLITTNGGCNLAQGTKQIASDFITGCKSASIWAKMLHVNIFPPDCLIAMLTPLLTTVGSTFYTNHGYVNGDVSVDGLASGTSNPSLHDHYAQTGVNPSTAFASANDCGQSYYGSSGVPDSGPIAYNGSNIFGMFGTTNGGIFNVWDITYSSALNSGNGKGFRSLNRTAANAFALYEARSDVPFQTSASGAAGPGTRPNLECYIGAWNNSGSPANYSTSRFSYMSFHTGFNSTDAQNEYNLVQAMRVSFTGGYG